jgi:hypothetical protein
MDGFNLRGPVDNVTQEIIEFGKDNMPIYRSQMVVAAEFISVTISLFIFRVTRELGKKLPKCWKK